MSNKFNSLIKNMLLRFKKITKNIPFAGDLPIIFILILTLCLFFIPPYVENDFAGDFVMQTVPWYHFLFTSLKNGVIPFWSPYSFLGMPFLFSPPVCAFHPFTLLIFLFEILFNSHNSSIEITGKIAQYMIIFSFCIGSIGMYFLCRKILSVSKLTALLAGLAFSFNPFLVHDVHSVFVPWAVSSLPWIFLFLKLLIDNLKFKYFFILTILNVLVFATGYPYYYVYFIVPQILLIMFYSPRKIFLYFLSLLNSVLLASFFLLPYLHIFLTSGRAENSYDFNFHSFASLFPQSILLILNPIFVSANISYPEVSAIFPGNFITWGTFAFIFLIYGLFSLKNQPFHKWMVVTFFISLFYSFGANLSAHSFFGTILPVIYKFRTHGRAAEITIFIGVLLIALGIEAISKRIRIKKIDLFFWFMCSSFFIALTLAPLFFWNKIAIHSELFKATTIMFLFLVSSLIIVSLILKFGKKTFLILGLIIMLIEYHYYFLNVSWYFSKDLTYEQYYQPNSLVPESSPNDLFRVLFETRFIANSSTIRAYNLQGYENNTPQSYGNLGGIYWWSPHLFQIANVKYVATIRDFYETNTPPEFVKIKTIKASERPNEFPPADANATYYLYKIKDYLPRYYIPEAVQPCDDSKCWKKENAPSLVIADGITEAITNPKGAAIDIEEYGLNNIVMNISTSQKTFIASSDGYDKGWSLSINNNPSRIYSVSNGSRGFIVPAGKSVVKMSYFPPYLTVGAVLSLIGLFSLYVIKISFVKKIIGQHEKKI
jgi:hypothetical protein